MADDDDLEDVEEFFLMWVSVDDGTLRTEFALDDASRERFARVLREMADAITAEPVGHVH